VELETNTAQVEHVRGGLCAPAEDGAKEAALQHVLPSEPAHSSTFQLNLSRFFDIDKTDA